jgi:hypothetical protein
MYFNEPFKIKQILMSDKFRILILYCQCRTASQVSNGQSGLKVIKAMSQQSQKKIAFHTVVPREMFPSFATELLDW